MPNDTNKLIGLDQLAYFKSKLATVAITNNYGDLDGIPFWIGTQAEFDTQSSTIPNDTVIFITDDNGDIIAINYISLTNKPQINGVTLEFNKTGAQLGLVDAVEGKGLSTEDYTTSEKNKLSNIATGAQVNVIEDFKVNGVTQIITDKSVNISVPAELSDLDDAWVGSSAKYETDKNTIPNNTLIFINDDGDISASTASYLVSEISIQKQIEDKIYQGTDLTVKFADEIAKAPYNGDSWKWIQARTLADDYKGIHICDYIPFTMVNGYSFEAQIMGINTYKNHGYPNKWEANSGVIGSHIDWCTRDLYPVPHNINKTAYNNGLKVQSTASSYYYTNSWVITDMYYWLNSSTGNTPVDTTVGQTGEIVDYTNSGIYNYLPQALKNVIIDKYSHPQYRAPSSTPSALATKGTPSMSLVNCGKVWLPESCEYSGISSVEIDYAGCLYQYPYFEQINNRVKFVNSERCRWWLMTPTDGSNSMWYVSNDYGGRASLRANYNDELDESESLAEANEHIYFPICFRTGTGNEAS